MGLSASQARLLSITARLSDNELHSQQIANSKVRLADRTQEASQEYIQALNATRLMYTTYDAKGQATQVGLTAGLMYTYADLKNQYGISNVAGQLLVNATDAKNFAASANMNEFLELYGVQTVDNPKFGYALESLYGQDYERYYGDDGLDNFARGTMEWVNRWNDGMTAGAYNSWAAEAGWIADYFDEAGGEYGMLLSELQNVPRNPSSAPVEPVWVEPVFEFGDAAALYNASACHSSVSGSGTNGIWHMEHNLCNLIWGPNGVGTNNGNTIKSSDGAIITARKTYDNSLFSGFGGDGKDAAKNLLALFEKYSDYTCVQNAINELVNLYVNVVKYLKNADKSTSGTDWSISHTNNCPSATDLKSGWDHFYETLENLDDAARAEYPSTPEYRALRDEFNKNYALYEKALEEYDEDMANGETWKTNCESLFNTYMDSLANLPSPKIPDESDPKTGWYVNLWHRMNGASETKSETADRNYKILEDNLLNSEDWLKFALEHGIVTFEKVQFVDEAEDITGLKTTKWQATTYAACTDISTVDDEVAIARAEAEYTKKLKEIEAKDKKYDNDIKKLDTEHNALQTEYESVKGVIDKNVERSFKAFS